MFRLTSNEIFFVAFFLKSFLYGIYSGIFAIYLQYKASKKETNLNMMQNLVFYFLCALYVLSIALFICDMIFPMYQLLGKPLDSILYISFAQTTIFACCDFIAQSILVYRCWIVWGRNIGVVIIPSILAFAFLGTWLSSNGAAFISSDQFQDSGWMRPVILASLSLSLAVNALTTGLIVFRILTVFRQANSDNKILGTTTGRTLRRIIFILIESGMTLFSVQLARLVVTSFVTKASANAYTFIGTIHPVLNGITPTIILVRISMGLSFDDEESMEGLAISIGSLRFASDHSSSVPEMRSTAVVGQDDGNDDDFGVQQSNEIEVVER